MPADPQQDVVRWLGRKKVATMSQMREHFGVCHMTVVRALKAYGYFTSYNHNAAYYVLHDVPRFDEWGLWSYRDIHFSKAGTLKNTLLALVEHSPAGCTTRELAERLQVDVGHLLSALVKNGRLTRETLAGRQVVYLATDPQQRQKQWERRQQQRTEPADLASPGLPDDADAAQVISILRQMIFTPEGTPELWTRQLKARGVRVTAGQVRRVIEYYALEKKRPS